MRGTPLHERAVRLVSQLSKSFSLAVSQLVVAELYAVYSRTMRLSELELEALVEYSIAKIGAPVVDVDCSKLFKEARRTAYRLRLRVLDLLHVVSAYLAGAEGIATFDGDIIGRAEALGEELGLKVYS